jgi:bifunctional non-homologous end joining protein LigD
MLATLSESAPDADLHNPALIYEPKYDGIRALVSLQPGTPSPSVTIWSRAGNDKTTQFPEVVRGLKDFGRRLRAPVLLDGEIVALDEHGEPAGFQRLQGRMHLASEPDIARQAAAQAAAIIVFDILRDGVDDLRPLPLTDRRARLERLFGASGSSIVRFGEYEAGDGRRLYKQAVTRGLEGLVVKTADSIYESNRRSRAWRKVKLVQVEEFVVGGWTDPRLTRSHLGALLLGMFDGKTGKLRYTGHTGTGFTERELARLHALLRARATEDCPFRQRPPSNEHPHWVRPDLVVQVKFSEWTDEGYLRHPVYLGLRDDVEAGSVRWREPRAARSADAGGGQGEADAAEEATTMTATRTRAAKSGSAAKKSAPLKVKATRASKAAASREDAPAPTRKASAKRASADARATSANHAGGVATGATSSSSSSSPTRARKRAAAVRPAALAPALQQAIDRLVGELRALEDAKRDGTLVLPDGSRLDVTNPAKVFWPAERLTKGDLLRYYVQVAPWLVPIVADRPLVMKRFPNGVTGKAFYQQRAPDDVPDGVRVDMVEDDGEESGAMPRLVGGSMQTLLYMAQLGAISQDPWFSRVQSPDHADYVALDLDPMPGVPFTQVLDVARHVHERLDSLDVPAFPKTSGASGLHIYIPLPPNTSYEAGQLFCNIIAAMVAIKHRRIATVERAVAKRGKTVYIDYLQNIEGKTLATAYSARASAFAGVSMPLTWDEVYEAIEPQDFTLKNAAARIKKTGDLWEGLRTATPLDLRATLERLSAEQG